MTSCIDTGHGCRLLAVSTSSLVLTNTKLPRTAVSTINCSIIRNVLFKTRQSREGSKLPSPQHSVNTKFYFMHSNWNWTWFFPGLLLQLRNGKILKGRIHSTIYTWTNIHNNLMHFLFKLICDILCNIWNLD